MARKILALLLLLLLAIPAGVLVLENWRGKRMRVAIEGELREKGEILDLALLMPRPAPARSNAFHELVFAGGRLEGASEIAPPAILMIGPGRAIPGSRLEKWKGAGQRVVSRTRADLGLWITNHAAELSVLDEVMSRPFRRASIDYSAGMNLQLPPLGKIKAAAEAMNASAAAAIHEADFDGALADLMAMSQLERDLADDPLLIQQLVRLTIAAMASRRAWDILHAGDWSDGQLAALQEALPSRDFAEAIVRSIEVERAVALSWMTRFPPVPPTPNPGKDLAERLLEGIQAIVGQLAWYAWGDQNIAYYHQTMQRIIDVHREAAREHSLLTVTSNAPTPPLPATGMNWLRTRIASSLIPTFENPMRRTFHYETERAMTECGIALRRFQSREGRLPANLDELVPEYLERVPIDRMDGKPLRYRLNADGTFVLWSVGDDLVDDGGDGTWQKRSGNDPTLWIGKDAVWPQAASLEEYRAWLETGTGPAAAPVASSVIQ